LFDGVENEISIELAYGLADNNTGASGLLNNTVGGVVIGAEFPTGFRAIVYTVYGTPIDKLGIV
jgi:hypothetical protein